ncbi:MAG: hypothetical protein AB8B50_00705 [Pirellulaceae bacterium]
MCVVAFGLAGVVLSNQVDGQVVAQVDGQVDGQVEGQTAGQLSQGPTSAIVPVPAGTARPLSSVLQNPRANSEVDSRNAKGAEPTKTWNLEAKDWNDRQLQRVLISAYNELDAAALITPEDAISELEQSLAAVERYVRPETANGKHWMSFLQVDAIRAELEKANPAADRFAEFEMDMQQNYVGLENGPFLKLRDSLGEVKRAIKYGKAPDRTIQIFERRIDGLVESLNEPLDETQAGAYEDISRMLNLLADAGQAKSAQSQIRSRYSSPNVLVSVRECTLNRFLARAVAEPSPVNECILGTRILGNACLSGSVSADLTPMQGAVAMRLNLSGYLSSNNRGYNRGVVLNTTGDSPIHAMKPIVITQSSISSSPASVSTNLTTRINSIQHRLRIVRRIARRKAAEQKPQADQISEGRLRRKLQTQYDDQVEGQLAPLRTRLAELQRTRDARPEFQRLDLPRPAVVLASTHQSIDATVVQAATYQLAASGPCPIPKSLSAGAIIEIHQSILVNALETLLGDRVIEQHDLDDLAKQFLGSVPEELKTGDAVEPFLARMPAFNPVQVQFDDGQVKVTLRFSRLEGNDRKIAGAVVSATYQPELVGNRLRLTRIGDLEIELPLVRSSSRRTILRSAAKVKLEEVFKESFETQALDLRRAVPNAPDIRIESIKFDEGWAQIAIR